MNQIWLKKSISRETIGAIFIIFIASVLVLTKLAFGFNLAIFGLGALGIFILSFFFPFSGLSAGVFLAVVFERFFTLEPFWIDQVEYKIYLLDFLIVGMSLGILFQKMKGSFKWTLQKADYFLLVFIGLNGLYFLAGLLGSSGEKSLVLSTFKNYAFYPLTYFLTFLLVDSKEKLERLAKFFLAACSALIFFILAGFWRGEGFWIEFTPLSTIGTRTLAFTHAFYLSLAVIAMLAYFSLRDRVFRNNDWIWVISIWILGIIGSLMRHLWLGIILALLAIWLSVRKEAKKYLAKNIFRIGAVFIIGVIILGYLSLLFPASDLSQQTGRVLQVVGMRSGSIGSSEEDESFSWRGLVWGEAFRNFIHNPVLGMGTGKKIYVEKEFYRDFIEIRNVHNSYLSILFQLGLLGFIPFMGLIFESLKNVWKRRQESYSIIFGTLFLFLLFVLNFQPYLETNLLAIFFWMNLGILRNLKLFSKV